MGMDATNCGKLRDVSVFRALFLFPWHTQETSLFIQHRLGFACWCWFFLGCLLPIPAPFFFSRAPACISTGGSYPSSHGRSCTTSSCLILGHACGSFHLTTVGVAPAPLGCALGRHVARPPTPRGEGGRMLSRASPATWRASEAPGPVPLLRGTRTVRRHGPPVSPVSSRPIRARRRGGRPSGTGVSVRFDRDVDPFRTRFVFPSIGTVSGSKVRVRKGKQATNRNEAMDPTDRASRRAHTHVTPSSRDHGRTMDVDGVPGHPVDRCTNQHAGKPGSLGERKKGALPLDVRRKETSNPIRSGNTVLQAGVRFQHAKQ